MQDGPVEMCATSNDRRNHSFRTVISVCVKRVVWVEALKWVGWLAVRGDRTTIW